MTKTVLYETWVIYMYDLSNCRRSNTITAVNVYFPSVGTRLVYIKMLNWSEKTFKSDIGHACGVHNVRRCWLVHFILLSSFVYEPVELRVIPSRSRVLIVTFKRTANELHRTSIEPVNQGSYNWNALSPSPSPSCAKTFQIVY